MGQVTADDNLVTIHYKTKIIELLDLFDREPYIFQFFFQGLLIRQLPLILGQEVQYDGNFAVVLKEFKGIENPHKDNQDAHNRSRCDKDKLETNLSQHLHGPPPPAGIPHPFRLKWQCPHAGPLISAADRKCRCRHSHHPSPDLHPWPRYG